MTTFELLIVFILLWSIFCYLGWKLSDIGSDVSQLGRNIDSLKRELTYMERRLDINQFGEDR